ncbi:hypothetical protein [Streptomyces sp. NBC_01615]|uniref:hypothetical protein n=1 Tax=Streptomyces sp. NBC_01615 TaxID=2975898 RepID=UPI003864F986
MRHSFPAIEDVLKAGLPRDFTRSFLEAQGLAPDDALVQVLMALGDGMVYQRVAFGEDHHADMARQIEGL